MITQKNIKDSTEKVVLSFIKALNTQDYKAARQYIADDMKFEGVMGTRDGDDVCLFYDIDMGGKVIFSSGWYHVIAGKIAWFKVIFDPRPLLEGKK